MNREEETDYYAQAQSYGRKPFEACGGFKYGISLLPRPDRPTHAPFLPDGACQETSSTAERPE